MVGEDVPMATRICETRPLPHVDEHGVTVGVEYMQSAGHAWPVQSRVSKSVSSHIAAGFRRISLRVRTSEPAPQMLEHGVQCV